MSLFIKLKEMFEKMVREKNIQLIPLYYHSDLLLYTNNQPAQNYPSFLSSHEKYYASSKQYQIEYDEDTFVEAGNKIAGRLWISVTESYKETIKMEIILIAQYKDGKIYRLWELTYPDWSQNPTFKVNQ